MWRIISGIYYNKLAGHVSSVHLPFFATPIQCVWVLAQAGSCTAACPLPQKRRLIQTLIWFLEMESISIYESPPDQLRRVESLMF